MACGHVTSTVLTCQLCHNCKGQTILACPFSPQGMLLLSMLYSGGLLFGVPSAIIFVPYITFGKWDAARKRILLVICIPLLILMFLVGFLTFYLIPTPDFCSFCHYINCAYSAALCPAEFTMPNSNIFSL